MPVPPFVNLGEPIRDLLNDGYIEDVMQLEVNRSRGIPGQYRMTFNSLLARFRGANICRLKLGYEIPGLAFSATCTPPNPPISHLRIDNLPTWGTTMWLSNADELPLRFVWSDNNFNMHGGMSLNGNPIVTAGGVCKVEDVPGEKIFVGGQLQCDVAQRRITDCSVALNLINPDFLVHVHCSRNFRQLGVGYYQRRFGDELARILGTSLSNARAASTLAWDGVAQRLCFNLMLANTFPQSGTAIRAKINTTGRLGLSATTSIAPNLGVTLCTHIGLRHGVRTTFGLSFNYGEQEPSDEVAENCYNCCV